MDESTRNAIEGLQEKIRYHRQKYYDDDAPVISDAEFDALHDQLLSYQKVYPEITDAVGFRTSRSTIPHVHRMLSLKSSRERLDIHVWFSRYQGDISCEPKLDGLSLELVYRAGRIVTASTRSDGVEGEDVTWNTERLDSVPSTVSSAADIEIYGEIYLTHKDFLIINRHRVKLGKGLYINPRNAAAGILRSRESFDYLKYLQFFPYTVYGIAAKTQSECFSWLCGNGFSVLGDLVVSAKNCNDIDDYIQAMKRDRAELAFPIDGLVFKYEDIDDRALIADSPTHPNWAYAYKFEPSRVTSRLDDVIFQVGKSGVIAPVGILKAVRLRNSWVTRASLFNREKMLEKDIKIGDSVIVEMANDVIPYISEVVLEDRVGKEVDIVFPTSCPSCGCQLFEYGKNLICTNDDCNDQVVGRLANAVGRKGFNIKGLGVSLLTELVIAGVVKNIADVFELDSDTHLTELVRCAGERNALKIVSELDRAKDVPLHKFILALNIRESGAGTASKLSDHYRSMENLIRMVRAYGVDSTISISKNAKEHIHIFFSNDENLKMIDRMMKLGVKIQDPLAKLTDGPLRRIAVTGTLSIPRAEFERTIRTKGYILSKTVNQDIEFLVAGDKPSDSKLDRAKRLGKPIVNEHDV